jgi:hypothetical protein
MSEDDKDFKELLKSLDASLNAQSFREDMRRRAHAWDAEHPWARLLCRNPLEQYK